MININNLDFAYPASGFRLVFDRLSVQSREKVAVIGPSGSGKTTLLNLVAGILVPGQGEVQVGDDLVSDLNDRQRRNFRITRIGFIFQDFGLVEYLDVLDNILHPYRISSALHLDSEIRAKASDLAANMGLGDKLYAMPDNLSQGEKQRAAICRAMLTGPELILADEATGNLDPENKDRILDALFTEVERNGATLLAVTHDHELLPRFDRVIDFQTLRVSDA